MGRCDIVKYNYSTSHFTVNYSWKTDLFPVCSVQLSQHIVTMTHILAATLLWLLLSNSAAGLLRCSQVLHRPQLEFQLIRSCSHSKAAVLASDRIATLEDCTQFATQHQALALNFANPSKIMFTVKDFNNSRCPITDQRTQQVCITQYLYIHIKIKKSSQIPSLTMIMKKFWNYRSSAYFKFKNPDG